MIPGRERGSQEQPSDVASSSREDSFSTRKGSGISLHATCSGIIFRNDENGYTVASFETDRKNLSTEPSEQRLEDLIYDGLHPRRSSEKMTSITATGYFPYIEEGDRALLTGHFNVHPSFGKQLVTESVLPLTPHSEEEIYQYLSSGIIAGIGPKTAEKIVSRFGEDTLRVLRDEPDLVKGIRGFSTQKAHEVSLRLREKEDFRELTLLLMPIGIGLQRIHEIDQRFGSRAILRIRENPYLLAEEVSGIGFRTADQIAVRLGLRPDSEFRYASAALHCLRTAENDGHTYVDRDSLFDLVDKLLRIGDDPEDPLRLEQGALPIREESGDPRARFLSGLKQISSSRRIVVYSFSDSEGIRFEDVMNPEVNPRISLPALLAAEISAAGKIARRAKAGKVFSDPSVPLSFVTKASSRSGIDLSEDQKAAVLLATDSYVSVITGGPGTGKTTIIRVLIDCFEEAGKRAVLCAPTGRAAKRMSEASGKKAGTIHRLLEPDPSAGDGGRPGFRRNDEHPIEADVVIVDESSMLDILLFDSLLQAVREDTQIVFVGDVNQLPSVGAGNVLADLITSEIVPVAELTQIYRQSKESAIVANAYRILSGQSISFDQSIDSECMLIQKDSPDALAQAAVSLYSRVLPQTYGIDVLKDAAVLCPSRKGPAGVQELNEKLQKSVGGGKGQGISVHGTTFYLRDKVMQTRNNYELAYENPDRSTGMGVFNGELGVVCEIEAASYLLTVLFDDGRIVRYDRKSIEDLDMAYAITVHKSQGSEYPVVILVVPPGYYALNHRNLLYTAVTRAKSRLFIVSSRSVLERTIRTTYTSQRRTSLTSFLTIYFQERS